MKKKDSKLKRPESITRGGQPKPEAVPVAVPENGASKKDVEISYTHTVVYNPFTKERVNIKMVETTKHKNDPPSAQGWFPIQGDFTVLLELSRNSPEGEWTVTGFPKHPIK